MKYLSAIVFLLCTLSLNLSAKFISNDKGTGEYFGIFGEIVTGEIFFSIKYLNIGKDNIQTTGLFGTPSILRLNPEGSPVQMGGEVNRTSTSNADLLPYAYGTVLDEASDYRGSGNFTMDFNNSNYVIVTFSNSNVDVHEMSIVVTPKRALGQSNLATFPSYGYVVLPLSPVLPRNKFQVHLFDTNDNVSQSKLFSFIAYKL